MSDGDLTPGRPAGQLDDLPEHLWTFGEFGTDTDRSAADATAGLASLGFIRAALRRRVRLWCTIALVGALAGFGIFLKLPPSYQASTSLILASRPGEDPALSIADDQAIAESRTVAGLAVRKLGLSLSPSSFLATYTATVVTDQLLLITVNAPSSSEAVSRATALAAELLQFRANQSRNQQKLVLGLLDQQISQAAQQVTSVTAQINQLPVQALTAQQRSQRNKLEAERSRMTSRLRVLKQATDSNTATTRIGTDSFVQGSQVLDAASPVPPHSEKKRLVQDIVVGLIGGLVVGLAIVVIGALISERLRRRDDIAYALGAPVKLSVGRTRRGRRLSRRPGRIAEPGTNVWRIAEYLRSVLPSRPSTGPASLAVVPVDDVQIPAASLISLAVACAKQGMRVVVADLCIDAPAARLMGVANPGVQAATVDGSDLVVVVPAKYDLAPVGPLRRADADEELAAACGSADLLLTLATVDPSSGGEHLAGWARAAVVVVTAGRSSAERIHAVGELIGLAGVTLTAGVLVGADKSDQSLGVMHKSAIFPDSEITAKPFTI